MAVNKIFIPTFISSVDYQPVRTLPHIYFYNGLKECEPYYIEHYTSTTGSVTASVQNSFPYVDNYDGLIPTTGSRSLLFYNESTPYGQTPTASLYTTYWDKYVSLLYNPRTRLINCSAIIPLADYFQMELNDIVQWRGNYYHLRAINDYNLKNGTCNLQLLGPIISDATQATPIPADCTFNFASVKELPPSAYTLPVSKSLWSYVDVSNTASYASGSTMFDLSGNGNNATILSSSLWTYTTSSEYLPYIELNAPTASGTTTNITNIFYSSSTNEASRFTLVAGYYLAGFNDPLSPTTTYGVPLFADSDNDPGNNFYGIYLFASASNQGITTFVDFGSGTNKISLGANSAASGSWYIVQTSYNKPTNTVRWNINGVSGSVTPTLIQATEAFEFVFAQSNVTAQANDRVGNGLKLSFLAVYTGSLTNAEMQTNYEALAPRFY